MVSLNNIKKRILSGDISSLLPISRAGNIHPSETAKFFNELPTEAAINAFKTFPSKKQLIVFSYLDILLQKKILIDLGTERATYILNKISSDDRLTLINSYKEAERSDVFELLDDKNKKATHDLLGILKKVSQSLSILTLQVLAKI